MTALTRMPRRAAKARLLAAAPALAALMLLGGCETANNALSTVADKSAELWNTMSSPFNRGEDKEFSRDPTRERRADVEKWERIRGSDDPTVFQTFIETYPDSALTHLARRRLATLQPTQGTQVASTYATEQPRPPQVRHAAGQMPPPAPPGQFPVPWVLGRWAIDCSRKEGGSGVTYNQVDAGKVRVIRDDGSAAVYAVHREDDILVLEADGLIYQDKIVSATELRSYAVKYNNQWHQVDLVYRKCD
ncbi:MAG: hypothetical protein RIE87_10540 [Rhodospirillales bacterium]|tara:strand:+ start:780 stop:1523 length:744 start_codon:yes stop_codon:yes gene_type:complete